ncbi:amidohydrolase family protein [Sphingomonas canadensis]|uniref:Amidohydrolase family protein n=1 Tax=Sphingomonas canadensis TaxID=1219257 RepID=A0ABW3H3E6_9SPHN|nr:amidohydrolase [Sphingomonas canadensis]MCW3835635.1 amidohydrolase [Sphingomonas canadensis]
MEIIDAQIHEPHIGGGMRAEKPKEFELTPELELFINVELAREAIDCVGAHKAIVYARREFNRAAVGRYPALFGAVEVFDYAAPDLEEQMAAFKATPGMLACRILLTNYSKVWRVPGAKLERTPLIEQGAFDRYWALAAKLKIPMFFGAHGFASVAAMVAERHPDLTIIIDHFGVTQSMVEPTPDRWNALPGLLALAKYPNVFVKLCGTPIISTKPYPYKDIWPHIHKILHAFGPGRCMWASDFTRQRWGTETPQGPDGFPPRKDWKPYADALYYMLHSNEISKSDKEQIFSGAVRRALNWKA